MHAYRFSQGDRNLTKTMKLSIWRSEPFLHIFLASDKPQAVILRIIDFTGHHLLKLLILLHIKADCYTMAFHF